jgi:uncharacterized lipoprotein YehR (DUF1307 family)
MIGVLVHFLGVCGEMERFSSFLLILKGIETSKILQNKAGRVLQQITKENSG